jgi:hypothetical protein
MDRNGCGLCFGGRHSHIARAVGREVKPRRFIALRREPAFPLQSQTLERAIMPPK